MFERVKGAVYTAEREAKVYSDSLKNKISMTPRSYRISVRSDLKYSKEASEIM